MKGGGEGLEQEKVGSGWEKSSDVPPFDPDRAEKLWNQYKDAENVNKNDAKSELGVEMSREDDFDRTLYANRSEYEAAKRVIRIKGQYLYSKAGITNVKNNEQLNNKKANDKSVSDDIHREILEIGLTKAVISKMEMMTDIVVESDHTMLSEYLDSLRIDKSYTEPILKKYIKSYERGDHNDGLVAYLDNMVIQEESRFRMAKRAGRKITSDEKRKLEAIKNTRLIAQDLGDNYGQNMQHIKQSAIIMHKII